MKKMIAALVLAFAAAWPAMAQEYIASGLPNSSYTGFDAQAYGSYASTMPAHTRAVKHDRAHVQMAPEVYVPQNQSDIIDR